MYYLDNNCKHNIFKKIKLFTLIFSISFRATSVGLIKDRLQFYSSEVLPEYLMSVLICKKYLPSSS